MKEQAAAVVFVAKLNAILLCLYTFLIYNCSSSSHDGTEQYVAHIERFVLIED